MYSLLDFNQVGSVNWAPAGSARQAVWQYQYVSLFFSQEVWVQQSRGLNQIWPGCVEVLESRKSRPQLLQRGNRKAVSHQCRLVTLQTGTSSGSSSAVMCSRSEGALPWGSASLLVVEVRRRWTHVQKETLSPLPVSNHSESPNPHAGSVREQIIEGVQLAHLARCSQTPHSFQ